MSDLMQRKRYAEVSTWEGRNRAAEQSSNLRRGANVQPNRNQSALVKVYVQTGKICECCQDIPDNNGLLYAALKEKQSVVGVLQHRKQPVRFERMYQPPGL